MSDTDFFRARLDVMIDLRHPLAVLATRRPWDQIEASVAPFVKHKPRMGRFSPVVDLFGTTAQVAGVGVSPAERPRLPIRLMVSLLYLKHAYGLSDDEVVQRWAQDVYFQLFSGQSYFQPRQPCDSSLISRFRKGLGEPGVEELLKTTIDTAVALQALKKTDLQRVIVDSTVQEKAIAHPTDSRLLEVARKKLVRLAQRCGIALKQTYDKECTALRRRAGGYAHAKQFKRLRRVVKRQRTVLGVLMREVQRKMVVLSAQAQAPLKALLSLVERIFKQQPKDKANTKVFALHAPEVNCIGKGKARQPYEWGCKVSIAVTHEHGLVVGARSFAGNPFDGHTLAAQLEQTTILLQDQGVKPHTAVVDLGYRGVDADNPGVTIIHRGCYKSLTNQQRRRLRRRQAIEPVIGHLKDDHGMRRCWLKGQTGDALNVVLAAAGFNIKWLMRAIVAKGIKPLWLLFFAPVRAGCLGPRPSHPRRSTHALADELNTATRAACSEHSDGFGEAWVEFFNTDSFQFFSGQQYYEPRLACDSSLISRFRKDLGEPGVEELLKTTFDMAGVSTRARLACSDHSNVIGEAEFEFSNTDHVKLVLLPWQ